MDLIIDTWDFMFSSFKAVNDDFITQAGIIGSFIVFMIIFRKLVRLFKRLI